MQNQNSFLLKPIAVTVFVIGFLNFIAIKLHLFWTTTWFDMIMHFLGGLFIGLSVLFFIKLIKTKESGYSKNLFRILFFVFIIGTFWEIFELLIRATNMSDLEYFSDTGMDYVMDLFGGLVSVWFYEYKRDAIQN